MALLGEERRLRLGDRLRIQALPFGLELGAAGHGEGGRDCSSTGQQAERHPLVESDHRKVLLGRSGAEAAVAGVVGERR
jgi:hypothetical protein